MILLAGGIFVLVWAINQLSQGRHLTAVIAFGVVAVAFQSAFFVAYLIVGDPKPRIDFGPDGTVIRSGRLLDYTFVTGMLAGVASAVLYFVCAFLDLLEYELRGVLRVTVPTFFLLFLGLGIRCLYRYLTYDSESYLRLNPEGFEAWSGYAASRAAGKWGDVTDIPDNSAEHKPREFVVFALRSGRRPTFAADLVTADVQALRAWVRFYWQHPEHRAELTDGRALRRLRDASLDRS
ncbi:hypothetical protein MHAS44199_23835 [Mycolicibacterium hassiacum DSM 44199]|nr:hypothetical protein [Mycolicibacterium hassiacum DSM 44199]